jgi:hypothetical protein
MRKPLSADKNLFSGWLYGRGLTTPVFLVGLPVGLRPHSTTVNRWRLGHAVEPVWARIIKLYYPDCPV